MERLTTVMELFVLQSVRFTELMQYYSFKTVTGCKLQVRAVTQKRRKSGDGEAKLKRRERNYPFFIMTH